MDLVPLNPSHDALLRSLQVQDDVWEFLGPLPEPEEGNKHGLFALMEGKVPIGIGGVIKSQGVDGGRLRIFCAVRSQAQTPGLAKNACALILTWAIEPAKAGRAISCIDGFKE